MANKSNKTGGSVVCHQQSLVTWNKPPANTTITPSSVANASKLYNKKQQRVEVRWLQSEAELYLKQWQRKYHQMEGIDTDYYHLPSHLLLNNHLELYDDWYRTSKRILDMDLDSMDCDTSYQYNTSYGLIDDSGVKRGHDNTTTSSATTSQLDYLWRREQQKILLNCGEEDDEEVTQSATSETTENIDDDEEVENICCGGNGVVKQRFDLNNCGRKEKTLNSINDSFNIYRVIIDNNKLPKPESAVGDRYASLLLNMATNSTIKHESAVTVADNHHTHQSQQRNETSSQSSSSLSSKSKKSSTARGTASSSKSSRSSSSVSLSLSQTTTTTSTPQTAQQRQRPARARPPPLRRQIFKCEHPGCMYQSDRNFNFLRHKRTHRKNRLNASDDSIINTSIINTSDSNTANASDMIVAAKSADLSLSSSLSSSCENTANNNNNNSSNYSKASNSLLTVRNTSDTGDCDKLFVLPLNCNSSSSSSSGSKHS